MNAKGSLCLVLVALLQGTLGQFQFGTNGPPPPPGAIDPNCADKIENCELFGADSCGGQYADWAKDNCALTCKFCTGPPTQEPPCVDVLGNCASYEGTSCSDPMYKSWATANCRRTCRMCSAATLAQLDALKTTIPPQLCVDKVDCRLYTKSACNGSFELWAKDNCANFCGFCIGVATTSKPCLDSRPNCGQYEKNMCSDPAYDIWVNDNCPQFCGRCNGVPTTPLPCRDVNPGCSKYQPEMCTGADYRVWAQENCRKFCNFCGGGSGPNTNGPSLPVLTPPPHVVNSPPPLPGKK